MVIFRKKICHDRYSIVTSVVVELRGFCQELKSAKETFKTKWAESFGMEGRDVSGDSPPRKLRNTFSASEIEQPKRDRKS